ncbi:expressed protein [Batrachochytrium dendrobatidis JAM81]|uniref:Expressed protein n=2 Tax=Batrachochytrium dendrobatidis TaxID=109871 RepID=F4P0X4_BATDJ|nr:uncharacterized protein BATDEDRAFT_24255 [Batrachochytrium dendrobatidis JAM81]EGF81667.1 expressed protein [Batrachochytrium dendrobatidis JAM81]KAJ8327820.1 hypothetical protein O5D80_004152 [Batrachochytrium dendrobatidis]KAK5669449.1 hypothetical protein QVD99_003844 [Batrachochytrium dendrobatidis]OAJ37977.1 hypothetical protein BDEG_21945 [Batrachochytrium dendrobatidis JEL423]|eukprot:XP_006677951.1 expressed protein [Batrachochytrium dendrobatidis JAM81]
MCKFFHTATARQRFQFFQHLLVFIPIIISYVFLFRTALTLQQQNWATLVPRVFRALCLPSDCNTDLPASSLTAPDESTGSCDLTVSQFISLLNVMGVGSSMSDSEMTLLHTNLDVTGNSRVSWGEFVYPFMGDGRWAVVVYIDSWRQAASSDYNIGFGLQKRQLIAPFIPRSTT